MTGILLNLVNVTPAAGASDVWIGPGHGPAGKRAFGGQFAAQALAAACRTVDAGPPSDVRPTSLHVQFLRAGDAAEPVDYEVQRVFDGRTAMSRRVLGRQAGRLLVTGTVGFAAAAVGPGHGARALPGDPEELDRTGPIGPAPSMPLDELDIRIADEMADGSFVRRLWWRTTVPLPDDPVVHACVAVFVTDIYLMDPAVRVHGHSVVDRSHRTGSTDHSVWFHRRVRADQWNLLESTSPAGARGRSVVTASLIGADGAIAATLVQEGMLVSRG
jgi:acyl-CoA thioesterase